MPAAVAVDPMRLHAFLRQQLDARPARATWRKEIRWDVVADERGYLHLWDVEVRIISYEGTDYLVDPPHGVGVDGELMTTRPYGLAEVDRHEGLPPSNLRQRLRYLMVASALIPCNLRTRVQRAWRGVCSLGLPRTE